MEIQRHFLGTGQPALPAAVDYFVTKYSENGWLDLSTHTLVTPGARASRRLNELLYQRVRADRTKYLPPKFDTIGSVPESLYESRLPFASEWVQQLTWARAVREVDSQARRQVFPQTPEDPNDYSESDWLALGRLLQGTYRGLAAESLSFKNVAEQGANMEEFPEPERERWSAMGVIQETYLTLLRQRQLWDRQTARIRAIHDKECATERQITFIGTADMRKALRQMLSQVARQVTALVFAPAEWEDRFDAFGCVVPAAWKSTPIDFSNAELSFVDTFTEQSAVATQMLAELGDSYASDEVTIGCPDERVIPHLERAFAAHDIETREVRGQRVSESSAYRCLAAIREALFSGTFDSYATLGRHPDVFDWLRSGVSEEWINQADAYRAEHLPKSSTERWLGAEKRHDHLASAFHLLTQLLEPLSGSPQPMSQWSTPIAKVLKTVYGKKAWERSDSTHNLDIGAYRAISNFLKEQATLPPEVAPILTATEALELLLEEIDDERVAPPAAPDAIEMLGWLELPLDDAPVMLLTGLTEGIVPASTTADLFLPNSLRRHLQIADNDRRYARDAYALSVILTSRPKVQIIVGRVDDSGEPLRPSRLLFAVPDEQVSLRWQDYFERDDVPNFAFDAPTANAVPANGAASGEAPQFHFEVPQPGPDCPIVESMSPTAFKAYLACPYRFYLRYVLQLKKVEDEAREMTGAVFGNLAHAVLESFGLGEAKDSENADDIFDVLRKLLKRKSLSQFGNSPPPAVRVQLRQLELRLKRFAEEQAKVARDGWRIKYVEKKSKDLDPIPRIAAADEKDPFGVAVHSDPSMTMPLHGVVDRIDQHEATKEYRILDYKTSDKGDAPDKVHRQGSKNNKEWIDLQLPLYRHIALAMNLDGIDGDINKLNNVGYILLPKSTGSVGFSMAEWSDHEFATADAKAREIVGKVLKKDYWPPLDPKYDDYASILMTTVPDRPDF